MRTTSVLALIILVSMSISRGQPQDVNILLEGDIYVEGEVISQDDWTITLLKKSTRVEVIIPKYEVLKVISQRNDVTADYLSDGQMESARNRLEARKKDRIKSLVGVSALFITFFLFSQLALGGGGLIGDREPSGTSPSD